MPIDSPYWDDPRQQDCVVVAREYTESRNMDTAIYTAGEQPAPVSSLAHSITYVLTH